MSTLNRCKDYVLLKRQYNIFDTQEQWVRQEICSFVYEEIKDVQKMQFIILILYLKN